MIMLIVFVNHRRDFNSVKAITFFNNLQFQMTLVVKLSIKLKNVSGVTVEKSVIFLSVNPCQLYTRKSAGCVYISLVVNPPIQYCE